jgi:quinol monooxygenase YgiN
MIIHATIKMRMPSHKVGEAVEILFLAAERTRVQPGCISCRIYQDAKEERVIMFDEMWRTQEDLDSHLRSDEYRNVLLVVEMADEKPEIIFNPLSDATGMETIEKARGT